MDSTTNQLPLGHGKKEKKKKQEVAADSRSAKAPEEGGGKKGGKGRKSATKEEITADAALPSRVETAASHSEAGQRQRLSAEKMSLPPSKPAAAGV